MPDMGMVPLLNTVGNDYVTGSTPTSPTTANGAAAAGANTIALTSATGYTTGLYMQIGPMAAGGPSEVHKILSVATNTVTFAVGETLRYSYATLTPTNVVTSPFTHTATPGATINSLTVEKNLGGLTSLQYAGAIINKASFKLTDKNEAEATYDVMASNDAQISPTATIFTANNTPYSLTNYSVSAFGSPDVSIDTMDLELDNMGKEHWTFASQRTPSLVRTGGFKATGKWTQILQNMTNYGNAMAGTNGALTVTLSQGANAKIIFTLPQIIITKISQPVKVEDVIMQDVSFSALRNPTAGYSLQLQVVNTQWISY
jgi:hypothetical protein